MKSAAKCSTAIVVAIFAAACYKGPAGLRKMGYQAKQAYNAVNELWEIPSADYDAFLKSFEVFERSEAGTFYVNATEDFQSVRNYYSVLNKLCTLGDVEKMYIPAIIDPTQGTYENQMISEEWWAD